MSKPVKFRMRDFVTFSVRATEGGKRYLHECRDSQSDSGYSLLTRVDATHAALVNGNMRFYRPDMMQAGCHTWLQNYKRPVLLRHDENCDPVGRVVEARYVDESYKYVASHGRVKNLFFYDSSSKGRVDLFKSVDWVYDNLQRKNQDYCGLGYCELGLNVTHPDAIAKVQRGEYATVSVGFETDAAICSICHQNWSTDGRCEHRLGSVVDGKRCFVISGGFDYQECSFVTHPADVFASVKQTELTQRARDSMAMRVFLLGQAFHEEDGMRMTDSLEAGSMIESDIEIVVEEDQKETDMEMETIRAEINGKDLTKERALALRTELAGNADAKRLLSTLKAKITKNGWNEDATVVTQEAVEARIATAQADFLALAADLRAAFVSALESDASAFGLAVPALTDAKETAAVVAPPATDAVEVPEYLATVLKDAKDGQKIVKHIDATRAVYAALDSESDKSLFMSAMSACMEVISSENWLNYIKSRAVAEDQVIVAKVELDSLHEGVEAYEGNIKKVQDSNTALVATNKTLMLDFKRSLASQIVLCSVIIGEKGFAGLNADQIQAEIDERAKRQLVSLQDSLKDLVKKVSTAAPEAISSEKTQEATDGAVTPAANGEEVPVREVKDSVSVDDKVDIPGEIAAGDAQRGEGTVTLPAATLEDLRSMRRSAAVSHYKQLKEKKS